MWLGALVFASAVFPVTIDRTGSSLIFFGGFQTRGLPIGISLPIIFAAVAATMAAIAQGVARLFQRFPPLEAYRLDVLGSVTGIAGFAILSFIGAPPVVWGAVIVGLFVFLGRSRGDGGDRVVPEARGIDEPDLGIEPLEAQNGSQSPR